jgi:hypothetical protein
MFVGDDGAILIRPVRLALFIIRVPSKPRDWRPRGYAWTEKWEIPVLPLKSTNRHDKILHCQSRHEEPSPTGPDLANPLDHVKHIVQRLDDHQPSMQHSLHNPPTHRREMSRITGTTGIQPRDASPAPSTGISATSGAPTQPSRLRAL